MKKINLTFGILAACILLLGMVYFYKNYMTKDTVAPEIKSSSDTIECNIDATDEELCQGLTATDDKDGDLTNQIMVSGIHVKDEEDAKNNEFNISYLVFDSANNIATLTRTLIYKDYTSPEFALSDPLKFTSYSDANQNITNYLTVEDCIEGDLTSQITLELSDDYLTSYTDGSYECSASVTNRMGDTATIPLVIDIYSDDANSAIVRPEIQLTKYIVYTKQSKKKKFQSKKYLDKVVINNSSYTIVDGKASDYYIEDNSGATEYDEVNDKIISIYRIKSGFYYNSHLGMIVFKDDIKVKNNVNLKKKGSYIVNYSITDPDTKQVGTANLIVVVR